MAARNYIARTPQEAAADFKAHGFTIVPALSADACDALIREQWTHVLKAQPVLKCQSLQEIPALKVAEREGGAAAVLKLLKHKNLRKVKSGLSEYGNLLTALTDRWCMHREFGACSDPAVFHLPLVRSCVRDNDAAYDVAVEILGTHALHCDINRSIQRLPGQGMAEMLHWDLDPFAHDFDAPAEAIGGKLVYTEATFVCVPGSNTRAWLDEHFFPHFGDMRAQAAGKAKFEIPHKTSQGAILRAMAQSIRVPAGHYICWDARLLHGTERLSTKDTPIEWGAYLGFFPAARTLKDPVRARAYEAAAEKARDTLAEAWLEVEAPCTDGKRVILGANEVAEHVLMRPTTELEDRLYSFEVGVAPFLWPSFDPIHYTPAMWSVTLDPMVRRIRRMTPEARADFVTAKCVTSKHFTDKMGTPLAPLLLALPHKRAAVFASDKAAQKEPAIYTRHHLRIATPQTPSPHRARLGELSERARMLLGDLPWPAFME